MGTRGIFLIVLIVALCVSIGGGFLRILGKVGATAALESWREQPRRAVAAGLEIAAIIGAATGFTVVSGWAGAWCGIAGYVLAGILVLTVWPFSQYASERQSAAHQAVRPGDDERRPLPGQSELLGNGKGTPTMRSLPLGTLTVYQWREPVPEDLALRDLVYQHAVDSRDGDPKPTALCGYRYDPRYLGALWGIGVAKSDRCPKCTQLLKDAHVSTWNIEPNVFG
jgi:hypothetical protein